MKIFLPFNIQDIGGTSIFAQKFRDALIAQGHEVYSERPENYDILFVIVHCHPKHLFHAKLHGKKIVHRLDGTYYWSVASWKYLIYNLPPKIIHRYFADVTIYQSEYSKYCALKFLGKPHSRKQYIIYNGVDTNLFSPQGETLNLRDNPDQEIFLSASKFRRTDQVLPLIEAMKLYTKKYNSNSKLVLIGSFSGRVASVPETYRDYPFVQFLGKVPNADLPKYERGADVFVFTHLNPPCPNNIIEAMACGLPICGVDDGAMSEITKPGENSLLIPAEGDAFWETRMYDREQFAENMGAIIKQKQNYSQASREIALSRFSLEKMLDQYLLAFDEILKA